MPFAGAVSNQTSIRSGGLYQRFLIVHTPSVIMQAQPASSASGLSNAIVQVGTPSTGTVAAIKSDYTVFITPSSDYASDLQDRPQECLITYARLDGNGTSVYIGETTFQWTTSQYVTVVNDIRVHMRRLRYINNVQYRDFGITYRKPRPRIYNLYHEVLEIAPGDSTVSKAFTPSADAMTSGDTISAWAWTTDQTISTGTASSQNITVDFTAGTHIVSLTVTTSAGVSHKLSVLIAVIPADYNSVIETGVIVTDMNHSQEGHIGTIIKYNDLAPLSPGSMALVCTKAYYNDDTTVLHTDMQGWLGESVLETIGDETYQSKQVLNISLLDIASQMQTITVRALPFEYKASPSAWGELTRVTPLDIVWHMLSELSTVASVSAVVFPTTYTNQTVLAYNMPNGTLLDVSRALAFSDNKGALQFAPNGECVFAPSLPYASDTLRDAAVVYSDFSTLDADINARYPAVGILQVEYVNAGATRYDSTEKKMRNFYGRAPAKTETGILEESIAYMVLPQNTGAATSIALAGQLAYDHWDASNENLTAELSNMNGGYLGLRQNQNAWVTLDVSAGDVLNSNITFDSTSRFIVNGVSQSYDAERGSLSLSANLRLETGNTANYSVKSQELLAARFTADLAPIPNVPAYPLLEESNGEGKSEDVYGDSYPDASAGMPDPGGSPEEQQEIINQPSNITESLQVPLTGETVTTVNSFPSGTNYLITYSAKGKVSDEWIHIFDFLTSNEGFVAVNASLTPDGTFALYSGGEGWGATSVVGKEHVVYIYLSFDTTNITSIASVTSIPPSFTQFVGLYSGTTVLFSTNTGFVVGDDDGDGIFLTAQETVTYVGTPYTGFITSATVTGTGDNPFGDEDSFKYGDAFFTFFEGGAVYDTGGAAGIKRNGAFVPLASVDPSAYNPSHEYSYVVSGTDAPMTFAWIDPDGDISGNSGSIQVTIQAIT